MRKSIFLSGLLTVLFLTVIGTSKVFCQEYTTCNYLVRIQGSWAIPERIDESELTNADKKELVVVEVEFEDCEEAEEDYIGGMSFLFSLDENKIMDFLEEEKYKNVRKEGGFIIGEYQEDEEDGMVEMAINLTEFIIEYRMFGVEDNPFFDEAGNKLYGIYRIVYKKMSGDIFVLEKEVNIQYDELPSGIPYEVTYLTTYLYYERMLGNTTIVKTGDEELYNDCMGYTGLKEIQQANLRIYPNPAKEQLTIEYGSSACFGYAQQPTLTAQEHPLSEVEVEIYNVVGQNVGANLRVRPENNETTIDISHLANGMYFLKIQTDNGMIMKRFVKQ